MKGDKNIGIFCRHIYKIIFQFLSHTNSDKFKPKEPFPAFRNCGCVKVFVDYQAWTPPMAMNERRR